MTQPHPLYLKVEALNLEGVPFVINIVSEVLILEYFPTI